MAQLTLQEFEACVTVLADGGAPERLRDQLVRLNAFHSRRGLGSLRAITERLYALSSGLRRDVPSTRAFQALWADFIRQRLTESSGRKLDELADGINQLLTEGGDVLDGKQSEFETLLGEYEEVLARKVGGPAARLDSLQKAVAPAAVFLRARPVLDVPIDPPEDDEHDHDHDHDHDHHHHHHDHDHDHDHDHAAHAHEDGEDERNEK